MTKTDPIVTDEQIKGIRSNHDHALSVKASAYVIRDIYEKEIRRLKAEKCVHCNRNDSTS